jgi:diguanylate cyclase
VGVDVPVARLVSALPAGRFEDTTRAVLAFLRQRFGFDLWMLTRTEGDDWIVLHCEDHGYGMRPGTVLRWSDSFCMRMVAGQGPRIAPCAAQVPAYASAPIGQQVPIQAYVGLPLWLADGALFGTLCAIDPHEQPAALQQEQPLLELLAQLLSAVLQLELHATEATRRAERLHIESLTDGLTGLYNRRAWQQLMQAEEERCRCYGVPAVVITLDLDDLKRINDTQGHAAGDRLIQRTAETLRQAVRTGDVVARLGGDEFGILCATCDRDTGESLQVRCQTALAAEGIRASIGHAVRHPSHDLIAAWESADQRMYAMKRQR